MVWTEIQIGCGDEDADDTTRMCKVTEHPWHNAEKEEENADVAAAATAVCWDKDPLILSRTSPPTLPQDRVTSSLPR